MVRCSGVKKAECGGPCVWDGRCKAAEAKKKVAEKKVTEAKKKAAKTKTAAKGVVKKVVEDAKKVVKAAKKAAEKAVNTAKKAVKDAKEVKKTAAKDPAAAKKAASKKAAAKEAVKAAKKATKKAEEVKKVAKKVVKDVKKEAKKKATAAKKEVEKKTKAAKAAKKTAEEAKKKNAAAKKEVEKKTKTTKATKATTEPKKRVTKKKAATESPVASKRASPYVFDDKQHPINREYKGRNINKIHSQAKKIALSLFKKQKVTVRDTANPYLGFVANPERFVVAFKVRGSTKDFVDLVTVEFQYDQSNADWKRSGYMHFFNQHVIKRDIPVTEDLNAGNSAKSLIADFYNHESGYRVLLGEDDARWGSYKWFKPINKAGARKLE